MSVEKKLKAAGLSHRYHDSLESEWKHIDVFVKKSGVAHIEKYSWVHSVLVPCRVNPDKNFRFAVRIPEQALMEDKESFDINTCDDLCLLAESVRRLPQKVLLAW